MVTLIYIKIKTKDRFIKIQSAKRGECNTETNYSDLFINNEKSELLSPLTLAFIGDGIFELMVRNHLVEHGSMPVGKLHSLAINYVSAKAQSLAVDLIYDSLTEQEIVIFKRGRNANSVKPPKNQDPADYRKATALEALFGYLFLKGDYARISFLFNIIWNNSNNN